MELREKIADAIDYSGVVYDSDLKRAVIVQLADAILQIPEIRDAQERIKRLEQEIDAMDGDMREMGYGD